MTEDAYGSYVELVRVHEDGSVVIAVHGDLSRLNAGAFIDYICAFGLERSAVVLDMGDTTFVDAEGVEAMLASQRRLVDHGSQLTLRNPRPTVMRLLHVLGCEDRFSVET
ncbi:MAG TPA: STAS domain-containing protein [Acidimicrobiales bacterium]|jgi:anti-anti-sigma factor|nr:STAS domain-containing protein [Acidimicrobiales bacterium]